MERRSSLPARLRAERHGELAAVVAARRLDLDLTQIEASDLADVASKSLRAIEKGQNVTLDNLSAVLNALGLHLEIHRGATGKQVTASPELRALLELNEQAEGLHP